MRRRKSISMVALLVLASLFGCESNPTVDRDEYFRTEVVPVLEGRCGAGVCHGISPQARAAGEDLQEESFLFHTDQAGRITNWRQARRESLRFVNTVEDADFSTLIRKPLPRVYGGLAHGGYDNFVSPDDPALSVLRKWIEWEEVGGEDPPGEPLRAGEEFFSNQVLPHLVGRNCAATNCHGSTAFNAYRLDPGMPDPAGGLRFSRQMMAENYEASRAFLSFGGDGTQSRLLRKGLPLDRGGITHRGGNQTFFVDLEDSASQALIQWAGLERELLLEEQGDGEFDGDSLVSGVVYVRGPARRGSVFDVWSYQPGSDLWLRRPAGPDGEDRNLTSHLHDSDADIRDPAISRDGRRVAFAMRRGGEEGFSLFELDLKTEQARRLTDERGVDVMPTYGPGGRLYFVSDRHGEFDQAGAPDLGIYELYDDGQELEPRRISFGSGAELHPRYFDVGDMRGRLVLAHRRSLGPRDETVGFSLPLDFHADYHIYFGVTAAEDHFLVFEEMPDGRALTVVGDPENRWRGGKLAIVDRNLGPDLRPGRSAEDAAVPAFARTLRELTPSARASGVSVGGVYADPVALPDGTILVAWAPGPIDLSDPDENPRFRILHLTLNEAPAGCSGLECLPRIQSAREWIGDEETGLSLYSPRPVMVRPIKSERNSVLNREDPTLFAVTDAAVNQGIRENLFADGTKQFGDDIRYLRLLEALPRRVGDDDDLSEWSLSGHLRARILGEVDLEADGSAYLQIPPRTPFRVQLLDEDRMARGEQHNRWIFAWPGQAFPESVERSNYDVACGGCHGSRSGIPEDVMGSFDSLSGASATLAAFEDRNPRRPREPIILGEATSYEVTFVKDVQPILDRHCAQIGCHGAGSDLGGSLNLSGERTDNFSLAYEALMAPGSGSGGGQRYVDAPNTSARSSHLIEVVTGRELAAPGALGDHVETPLSDEELLTLIRWIETGAAYRSPRSAAEEIEEGP